jgi:hypothetical protein
MWSVFVEYGRIMRSVGPVGVIKVSTHEAQGVSLRVSESASVREADPPPPFVHFSGLKEILASPRLASSGARLLLMQATSRARPFGGPLRAKHFHVALALPFLSLPHDAESRPAVEGLG